MPAKHNLLGRSNVSNVCCCIELVLKWKCYLLSMDYVDSAVLSFSLSGASPLHRSFGVAVNLSHLASRTSAASLQRNPALPPCLTAVWQQTRHGSFFNKCKYMKRILLKSPRWSSNITICHSQSKETYTPLLFLFHNYAKVFCKCWLIICCVFLWIDVNFNVALFFWGFF